MGSSTPFRNKGNVINDSWLETRPQFPTCNEDCRQSVDVSSSDNWTEVDNFEDRPTGNLNTFLQPIDFREFN